jgi:hypothetical protein
MRSHVFAADPACAISISAARFADPVRPGGEAIAIADHPSSACCSAGPATFRAAIPTFRHAGGGGPTKSPQPLFASMTSNYSSIAGG